MTLPENIDSFMIAHILTSEKVLKVLYGCRIEGQNERELQKKLQTGYFAVLVTNEKRYPIHIKELWELGLLSRAPVADSFRSRGRRKATLEYSTNIKSARFKLDTKEGKFSATLEFRDNSKKEYLPSDLGRGSEKEDVYSNTGRATKLPLSMCSMMQSSLCRAMAIMRNGPISTKKLADALGMTEANLNRNLKQLAEEGYVRQKKQREGWELLVEEAELVFDGDVFTLFINGKKRGETNLAKIFS